jgi:hypothetical protein
VGREEGRREISNLPCAVVAQIEGTKRERKKERKREREI